MRPMPLERLRKPRTLLENRVSIAGPDSELSVFDTYCAAQRVGLSADQLLYCGMVTGRKVMHSVHQSGAQEFLPHESFVMASGETVEIDFPEAREDNPTTCLTVEIAREKVRTIADRMADVYPAAVKDTGLVPREHVFHTHHTVQTQALLNRLVNAFTENQSDRDVLIELCVSELIVRMLRHQGRGMLLAYCREQPDASGLTAAMRWVEDNLAEPMDIDALARLACMSRSRLYTQFKQKLGCTPCEFQRQLRMQKALEQLQAGDRVSQVCFGLGFSEISHFSRCFRQFFGVSPSHYRASKGNR